MLSPLRDRRPLFTIVAGVVALALVVTGALGVAPAASASAQPRAFTVFLTFGKPEVAKTGAKAGIGDLRAFQGGVSETFGGARSGTYTVVTRVATRKGSGTSAVDTRDTRLQVRLSGGTILAQSFLDDPADRPPTGTHILPVIGGTGVYATARGTVIIRPVGRTGTYALAFDVFIDSRKDRINSSVSRLTVNSMAGPAGEGVGATELASGVAAPRSVISVGTIVQRSGSSVSLDTDLLITLPGGTVVARDVVPARRGVAPNARYAVIGGTGEFAGRRGEVRLTSRGANTRVELSLAPTRSGRATIERWCENSLRTISVNDILPGITAWQGRLRTTCKGGQDRGSATGLLRTYPEISLGDDSVTPQVVSMGQSFQVGTMATAGFVIASGKRSQVAIVGGTGNFGGVAGGVAVQGAFGSTLAMRGSFRR